MPWKTQEKTSSREAVRRGSTLNSRLMSRATLPQRMMATVLLAVAQSARDTSTDMPIWADLPPCIIFRSFSMSQTMPPLWAMSSEMPPQKRARKKTSLMPVKPFQMSWAKVKMVRSPAQRPMIPAEKMPRVRVRKTLTPRMARVSTST